MLYTETIKQFEVMDIDAEVAEYCAVNDIEIYIFLRSDSGFRLRINADIYSVDEDEDFDWKSSGCDSEMKYDGDFNWDYCDYDEARAKEFLQAYVAHQRSLYPRCRIAI